MLKHIVFILTTCFISSCLGDRKAYIIDHRRDLFTLHQSDIPTYLFLDEEKSWYKTELLNNQGKIVAKILDKGQYNTDKDTLFLYPMSNSLKREYHRFLDQGQSIVKPHLMEHLDGTITEFLMGRPKDKTDKKTTGKIWKALKNEGAAGSGANQ